MNLVQYEIDAIYILLTAKFDKYQIHNLITTSVSGFEFTGAGYFIEIQNDLLPIKRSVYSHPMIIGHGENSKIGFIIFIENRTMIVECHTWGEENIQSGIRDQPIMIEIVVD